MLCFQRKRYRSVGCEPTSKALDTLVQHGEWFVSFLPFLLDSFLTLHFIPIPPFKNFKLLILIIFSLFVNIFLFPSILSF